MGCLHLVQGPPGTVDPSPLIVPSNHLHTCSKCLLFSPIITTVGTGKTHVIVSLLSTLIGMFPPIAVNNADADSDIVCSTTAHKIIVKGLPWVVNDRDVWGYFKDCGTVAGVEMLKDESGRASGNAYVYFVERTALVNALGLNGRMWYGTDRWLRIVECRDEEGIQPDYCDTVFVGNLPYDVDEQLVREMFADVGTVFRVKLDRLDDSLKCFAHVQFTDGNAAEGAVKKSGKEVNGNAIRVDYVKAKPKAASTIISFEDEVETVVGPPPKPLRLLVCAPSNKAVSGTKMMHFS